MTSTQGFPNARMTIYGTNLASMQNLRTMASAVMLGPGAGMADEVQLQLDVGAADAAEDAPELDLVEKPGPLAHCHVLQLGGRNAVIALLDGLSREVLMWHAAGHLLSARLQGALRHRPYTFQGQQIPQPVAPFWLCLARKAEVMRRAVNRPQGALLYPSRAFLPAATVTPLGPLHAWAAGVEMFLVSVALYFRVLRVTAPATTAPITAACMCRSTGLAERARTGRPCGARPSAHLRLCCSTRPATAAAPTPAASPRH